MNRRSLSAISLLALALSNLSPGFARQAPDQTARTDSSAILCRVLEAHVVAAPPVLAVIFHQSNSADQARLAALLREHSGAVAEIRFGDAPWMKATVVRLKNCFGRGLLFLPANAGPVSDGATFLLRF
jgi:hypothetical protein